MAKSGGLSGAIEHSRAANQPVAQSPSGVKAGVTDELILAIDDVLLSGRAIYPNGTAYKSLKAVVSRARSALGVGDEGMGEATVERVARALAADELGMGDPQAVVATIVEREWRSFERQARVALGAIQGDAK